MTSVVLVGIPNVVSTDCVRCPSLLDAWVKIGLDLATKGSKWVGIVVVGAP